MRTTLRQLAVVGVCVLFLTGCRDTSSRQNPFKSGTREWAVEEMRRCTYETSEGGFPGVVSLPDRDCVEFGEPRFLSGVWLNDFEGSAFFEGVKTADEARRLLHRQQDLVISGKASFIASDLVWLEADRHTIGLPLPRLTDGAAYAVTMLGKVAARRQDQFGYGHMGMSQGLVLANYILTLKRLD